MNGREYEPSGQLGIGLVLIPAVAFPLTLLFALAYAYADVYCPIAGWVTALIVAAYVFALGALVGQVGTWAKVRSEGFMALAGVATGLLGLYAAWAAFEVAVFNRGSTDEKLSYVVVLLSPGGMWGFARAIAQEGWYSIGGATPSGLALWLLWGIEALVIVLGTAAIAGGWHSDHVFCEPCDRWCDDAETTPHLALPEGGVEAIAPAVEGRADGVTVLEGLAPIAADAPSLLKVDLKRCPTCEQTFAVRLRLVTNGVDEKGNKRTETKDLSKRLLVEPAIFRRLEALGASPPAA